MVDSTTEFPPNGKRIFEKILYDAHVQGIEPSLQKQSIDWFRQKAMSINLVNHQEVFENYKERFRNAVQPGRMLLYQYDAKHKKKLPYFDQLPLIFYLGPFKGGHMGLNLHYLPPQLRAYLMDELYETVTSDKIDFNTRVNISYQSLAQAGKSYLFRPCVKNYLTKQMRSKFFVIDPTEWDIALMLPFERFSGASRNKVWQDSLRRI